MDKDTEIFKGKSFSDIAKDLYGASKKKESQINLLISELKPFVQNIGDATIIVPLIKDYMDIGVKNDEHLIKLATVIQRIETAAAKGDGEEFDLSELQDLIEEQEALDREVEETQNSTEEDDA